MPYKLEYTADLKHPRNYKLHMVYANGYHFVDTRGYKVTLSGCGSEFFLHLYDDCWRISEKLTGYYLCHVPINKGRQHAIDAFISYMNENDRINKIDNAVAAVLNATQQRCDNARL